MFGAVASLALCFTMGTIGEYAMHRFWMHRRGSHWYESHHVEHHGLGMNERHHMGLSGRFALVWTAMLPINVSLSTVLYPWHVAVWTIFQAWWFFSWEYVHRAIHDEPSYGWGAMLVPWFRWTKRHHLAHHVKTSSNFGAMFPWADIFFRTRNHAR